MNERANFDRRPYSRALRHDNSEGAGLEGVGNRRGLAVRRETADALEEISRVLCRPRTSGAGVITLQSAEPLTPDYGCEGVAGVNCALTSVASRRWRMPPQLSRLGRLLVRRRQILGRKPEVDRVPRDPLD